MRKINIQVLQRKKSNAISSKNKNHHVRSSMYKNKFTRRKINVQVALSEKSAV